MNRRQRLTATLNGQSVDRLPVSFYELNGLDEDTNSKDSFNIYSDPSWRPLIELAREKTDRIVMRNVNFKNAPPSELQELTTTETWFENKSQFTKTTIKAPGRKLTATCRRDPDINTVWQTEHLLKNIDDLKAYLQLPALECLGQPDIEDVLKTEQLLGDTGIVMIDTADPLCMAAELFDLADYTVIAMTQPHLFHQLLERFASFIHARTAAIARVFPNRLWRICGPEYASPPYLPPKLFTEYVVRYDKPMVESIQKTAGFARIHCHGNIKAILDDIISTGCDAIDPIEPPPSGDVELSYVRQKYGDQLILFGNLEVRDIEILPTNEFEIKIRTAIDQGTAGEGRGFVLMPSACPYGRKLSTQARKNYEKIVEIIESL